MRAVYGSAGGLPKTDFKYDTKKDCYTCPEGKVLLLHCTSKKNGNKTYKIKDKACITCPIKQSCTPQGSARRITRGYYENEIEKIRRRMQTPHFKSKL
ncbi:MAG: transposase [Deltaproteobacteria bacterium]|nr:transposase [Deltaproteobacteria bacterium]